MNPVDARSLKAFAKLTETTPVGVNLHGPTEAFGALIVSGLLPVVQRKWVTGINTLLDVTVDHDGGTVTADSSELHLSTSTTTSSIAQYTSQQVITYRPGQAVVCRFTGRFTAGVASTTQLLGLGNGEDGLCFGYNGASFGVLRRQGGQVETQTLTITAAATGAGNVTVTLNGTAVVTALAGTETIGEVAAKIAASDYQTAGGGWHAYYAGDRVVFVAIQSDTRGGSYSYVDTDTTGATGSIAQTKAAVNATDTWVAQTSWNGDKADGTSTLPTLDPTKGNVYEIQYPWLGYGGIVFLVKDPDTSRFVEVHRIKYENANTTPSLSNPDLSLFAEADNLATSSDLDIYVGSMGGFKAGEVERKLGPRFSESNSKNFSTTRTNIVVMRVKNVFGSRTNKQKVIIDGFTLGNNGGKTCEYHLTKNPDLVGAPSWTDVDATNSAVEYDVATTAIVAGTGRRLFTTMVGAASGKTRDLTDQQVIELDPGDIVVFSGVLASGGAADILAGCTWVEST